MESTSDIDDSVDIYENLNTLDLGEEYIKVQAENTKLHHSISKLEADIEKLHAEVIKLKGVQDNLTKNISELYNTAKNELARRDSTIAALQREVDDLVFRRGKHKWNRETVQDDGGNVKQEIKSETLVEEESRNPSVEAIRNHTSRRNQSSPHQSKNTTRQPRSDSENSRNRSPGNSRKTGFSRHASRKLSPRRRASPNSRESYSRGNSSRYHRSPQHSTHSPRQHSNRSPRSTSNRHSRKSEKRSSKHSPQHSSYRSPKRLKQSPHRTKHEHNSPSEMIRKYKHEQSCRENNIKSNQTDNSERTEKLLDESKKLNDELRCNLEKSSDGLQEQEKVNNSLEILADCAVGKVRNRITSSEDQVLSCKDQDPEVSCQNVTEKVLSSDDLSRKDLISNVVPNKITPVQEVLRPECSFDSLHTNGEKQNNVDEQQQQHSQHSSTQNSSTLSADNNTNDTCNLTDNSSVSVSLRDSSVKVDDGQNDNLNCRTNALVEIQIDNCQSAPHAKKQTSGTRKRRRRCTMQLVD